ncbi:ParA family protein [Domibacillus aminovorans]|uniref:AAA domain-containing protein n=1 Tax=Domibacillus aminovorans TaxID=29332 RepID=A0A177L9R5_9BACI|nr:ParA family protein [Domibacillus aminovorans]OAH62343.1 hypothetical protein AWH49_10285 [Domibacillus aminovorans]
MAKIITAASTKGGVGKTTLVKYMAILARKEDAKVLIVDYCQNGDVAVRLGYQYNSFEYYVQDWMKDECSFQDVVLSDERTGIHFVAANDKIESFIPYVKEKSRYTFYLALAEKIKTIEHLYDYIFIDTHPSEANSMLSMALVASELVLIPVELDYSSVAAMERTIALVKETEQIGMKGNYQVVIMNVDMTKRKERLEELKQYLKELNIVSAPTIQRSVLVEDSDFTEKNLDESNSRYAKAVMAQLEEVFQLIKQGVGV